MRMLGSGLATTLEEMARKNEGACSSCLNLFLHSTLADRLWSPWITIAFSPAVAAAGILALYLLFFVLFFPLFLLSFVLTSLGSFVFLLTLILIGARSLARSLAFAGSTLSVQREMSADFMKRLSIQLENVAKMTTSLTSTLMHLASGRLARVDVHMISHKIEEVKHLTSVLPVLSKWIEGSVKELSVKDSYGNNLVKPEEAEIMMDLKRAVDAVSLSFIEVYPVAKLFLQNTHPSKKQSNSFLSGGSVNISSLVLLSGKCLQASELLKTTAVASRYFGVPGGDEEGLMWAVKQLLKINQGPVGSAKFSFSIMRQQLKSKFRAERITVVGKDGNKIDGVLVPCREQYDILEAKQNELDEERKGKEREKSQKEKEKESGKERETCSDSRVNSTGSNGNSPGPPSLSPPPSLFPPSSSSPSSSSSPRRGIVAPEFPPSALGTVLFCSPNAGLYECLSQAAKDSSWVGYYTSLGFDVCLFNYRGYSCSTGVPSPDAIKGDACTLADYLKTKRNVPRLIIHGESIGGMIACHVANTHSADLLVCDRTFASLDAVAARLLGQWAGYGLRFLIQWRTDVVSDYLEFKGPKIILQDPNDEIIANAASLKNGLSTSLILGDVLWAMKKLPQDYVLAGYLGLPMPCKGNIILDEAEDLNIPLREEFVLHLSACIMSISMKAIRAKQKAAARKESAKRTENKTETVTRVRRKSVEMRNLSNSPGKNNSTSATTSIGEGSAKIADLEEGNLEKSFGNYDESIRIDRDRERDRERDRDGGQIDVDDDEIDFGSGSDAESDSGSVQYDEGFDDGDLDDGESGASSAEDRLEKYCVGDISDASMDPWVKVWMVIARCDGGSGQLLGQAASSSLDGVRAWICAVILLSSRSAKDNRMPPSSSSLFVATSELIQVTLHSELAEDSNVSFLRSAFIVLAKRAKDCSIGKRKGLYGGGRFIPSIRGASSVRTSLANLASLASWGSGSFISRLSLSPSSSRLSSVNTSASTPVRNPECVTKKERKAEAKEGKDDDGAESEYGEYPTHGSPHDFADTESFMSSLEGGTHAQFPGRLGGDSLGLLQGKEEGDGDTSSTLSGLYSVAITCLSGTNIGVGSVVPLHNGHNGWPSDAELTSLAGLILAAGFPIEIARYRSQTQDSTSKRHKLRGVR